jgi:hypothetical protein
LWVAVQPHVCKAEMWCWRGIERSEALGARARYRSTFLAEIIQTWVHFFVPTHSCTRQVASRYAVGNFPRLGCTLCIAVASRVRTSAVKHSFQVTIVARYMRLVSWPCGLLLAWSPRWPVYAGRAWHPGWSVRARRAWGPGRLVARGRWSAAWNRCPRRVVAAIGIAANIYEL